MIEFKTIGEIISEQKDMSDLILFRNSSGEHLRTIMWEKDQFLVGRIQTLGTIQSKDMIKDRIALIDLEVVDQERVM